VGSDGRPYSGVEPGPDQSLFEAIEQSDVPDDQTYVLMRGSTVFAVMNVFPYTSGHLMVLPKRAVGAMEDLDEAEFAELWQTVRAAVQAAKKAFNPDGINVGVNEGAAGGGSVPEHLHVHVVPRWTADTNFMTATANARILPIALADTWAQLRAAWPQ